MNKITHVLFFTNQIKKKETRMSVIKNVHYDPSLIAGIVATSTAVRDNWGHMFLADAPNLAMRITIDIISVCFY